MTKLKIFKTRIENIFKVSHSENSFWDIFLCFYVDLNCLHSFRFAKNIKYNLLIMWKRVYREEDILCRIC